METRARFALCVVAMGCIKSEAPMTEDQFCQEYARIECSEVADVCNFKAATCEPIRNDVCHATARGFESGGHPFNPANTDACLKKLGDAYKSTPIAPAMLKAVDDTCARVFGGTAKATEPCAADFDCSGSLICDKGHCGTLHVVAAGSGCANIGERCQPSEFCTNDTPNQLYLCVRRIDQGAACSLTHPCAEGLRCSDVCIPKLEKGDPCMVDDECKSGYCTRYVTPRTCSTLGLTFSEQSPSCQAYMTVPDGGTPMRGTNEVMDAATD